MNEPLFSVEAEEAALALLMTVAQVDGVGAARLLLEREQIQASDFSLPAHGAVYSSACVLLGMGLPADPVAVYDRLRSDPWVKECGGLKWLMGLSSKGDQLVSVSFPGYARQIRDFAVRRRLVAEARSVIEAANNPALEVGQALTQANSRFASIVYRRDTFQTLTEVMAGIQHELIESQDKGSVRLTGTGIEKLDRLIGGFPPHLIVVAGRPGAGKSAVAATLVQSLANNKLKCGVFSLEDRAPWLGYRLLSGASGVANHSLRYRQLNAAEWENAGTGFARIATFSDLVLLDDRRRMTASDIVQSARNMVVNHGCKALLIDHLLEVKPEQRLGRRDLEVEEALGQFRDVSNEYQIPVVVFTQLNRGAEAKKEPTLTDFKDAGAVEQMARVAIAIVRDGETIGLCVIKNTNGVLGRVDVQFIGSAAMVAATERQRGLYD